MAARARDGFVVVEVLWGFSVTDEPAIETHLLRTLTEACSLGPACTCRESDMLAGGNVKKCLESLTPAGKI